MKRLIHIFRCITSSKYRMLRIHHMLRQLYQSYDYKWEEVAKQWESKN